MSKKDIIILTLMALIMVISVVSLWQLNAQQNQKLKDEFYKTLLEIKDLNDNIQSQVNVNEIKLNRIEGFVKPSERF